MKKKICFLVILILILVPIMELASYAASNIKTYTYTTEEKNISSSLFINGGTIQYSRPSPVYDFFDENGNFNAIYTSEENVYWAKFNDNMEITETIKIPQYYDKSNTPEEMQDLVCTFGNAKYYEGYLYVVYGRQGSGSSNAFTEDTMAVVKYDKQGKIIAETKLIAAQNNYFTDYRDGTYLPFFTSSNCSLTINEKDRTLACFFQTHMYSGHQRAGLFFIDIDTMEWVSNQYYADDVNMKKYEGIRSYYSSHSLSQRIIATSDGGYLMADQNDASIRGLNITKVAPDVDGNLSSLRCKMVHFREGGMGSNGYNYTHFLSGNIIELSDGYLYVGAMERTLDMGYSSAIDESWDIFIQKYKKDISSDTSIKDLQMFDTEVRQTSGTKPDTDPNIYGRLYLTGTEKDYGIKWLTDLKNEKMVMQLKAVELENNEVAIIYETYDITPDNNGGYRYLSGTSQIYYMIIDGNGNIITSPTQISGVNLTQEEILPYKDGKIYWTSTEYATNQIKVNILDIKNPITYIKGDINGDGAVDIIDLTYGLRKLENRDVLPEEEQRGDVTGDGTYDITDVTKLLRYLAREIEEL